MGWRLMHGIRMDIDFVSFLIHEGKRFKGIHPPVIKGGNEKEDSIYRLSKHEFATFQYRMV